VVGLLEAGGMGGDVVVFFFLINLNKPSQGAFVSGWPSRSRGHGRGRGGFVFVLYLNDCIRGRVGGEEIA
jgi:hypothetical protein